MCHNAGFWKSSLPLFWHTICATFGSMKTTIDIPEKELKDAMRFTKAKTKREAVNVALAEFNRLQRAEALIKTFGTWDMASNEEIEAEQLRHQEERLRGAD
jgi:Arc/MetJ family transcription regulator